MTIKTFLRFCKENGITHDCPIMIATKTELRDLRSMNVGGRMYGNGTTKSVVILRTDNKGSHASNPIPGGTCKGDKRGNKK